MDDHSSLLPPIFILCDKCYWCATYIDKSRIPLYNICPQYNTNNGELTSFSIMSNESFAFDFSNIRELELEFKPRHKHNSSYPNQESAMAVRG